MRRRMLKKIPVKAYARTAKSQILELKHWRWSRDMGLPTSGPARHHDPQTNGMAGA
jgi:hypothetical protein